MTIPEKGSLVFGIWKIGEPVWQEYVYSLFEIYNEKKKSEKASLWIVDCASLSEEEISQLQSRFTESSENTDAASLLCVDEVRTETDENGVIARILLRTKSVYPLSESISKADFSADESVRLALRLCHAVQFLQEQSLPARKISADNVFVSADGAYWLGMFGQNTPTFMSPEQNRGETSPTDSVCSIGVLMYMLLNDGRLPLLSKNVTQPTREEIVSAVQRRLSGEPLPPPANASGALTGIVLKACAYKSKARYESTEEFAKVLSTVRSEGLQQENAENDTENKEKTEKEKQNKIKRKKKKIIRKTAAVVCTGLAVCIISFLLVRVLDPGSPVPALNTTEANKGQQTVDITLKEDEPTVATTQVQSAEVSDENVVTQTKTEQAETVTTQKSDAADVSSRTDEKKEQIDSYPEHLLDQINIYRSGNFHLVAEMVQEDETTATDMALTDDGTIYMNADIDGVELGILRLPDKTVFLVYPGASCYLELSKVVMKVMGINDDTFENISFKGSGSVDAKPDKIEKQEYNGEQVYACIYNVGSEGKYEKLIVREDGTLLRMESYAKNNTLSYAMNVKSIDGNVEERFCKEPTDYKKYTGVTGLAGFMGVLVKNMAAE